MYVCMYVSALSSMYNLCMRVHKQEYTSYVGYTGTSMYVQHRKHRVYVIVCT